MNREVVPGLMVGNAKRGFSKGENNEDKSGGG